MILALIVCDKVTACVGLLDDVRVTDAVILWLAVCVGVRVPVMLRDDNCEGDADNVFETLDDIV